MTTLVTRAGKGSALSHTEMDTNILIAVPASSNKTANYTVVVGDEGDLINVDTTSGDITLSLPAVATAGNGFSLHVQKDSSDGNTVIIDPNGSETVNGSSTFVLTSQYASCYLVCDGSEWHTLYFTQGQNKEFAELSLGKSTNNSTATTITALDTYYAVGGTWTEEAAQGMTTTVGTGTLTLASDGDYTVHTDVSMITDGSSEVVAFRFLVNGTATGPRIRRKVGTGSDVGALSMTVTLENLSAADTLQLGVTMPTGEGGTAGDTVTVENAVFWARKFG